MPEIKQKSFLSGIINDPRSTNPQGFFYGENIEVGNQKSIKHTQKACLMFSARSKAKVKYLSSWTMEQLL